MNPRFAPVSEYFPAGTPLNSNFPFSVVIMMLKLFKIVRIPAV